jgi:hypothetical protein
MCSLKRLLEQIKLAKIWDKKPNSQWRTDDPGIPVLALTQRKQSDYDRATGTPMFPPAYSQQPNYQSALEPICRGVDKESVVCTHNEVFLSHKEMKLCCLQGNRWN